MNSHANYSGRRRDSMERRAQQTPETVPESMNFSAFRTTGDLSDINVFVSGKEFKLHRFPLYVKCEFFRNLANSATNQRDRVELDSFPGGPAIFELIANYCYNVQIDITAENVATLRCAAEYLKLNGPNNLAEVTDRYLQGVLMSAKLERSLEVVVGVLTGCGELGEMAVKAGIVDKCVDSAVECLLANNNYARCFVDKQSKNEKAISNYVSSRHDLTDAATGIRQMCRFPFEWFRDIVIKAQEKNLQPAALANVLQCYIDAVLQGKVEEEEAEKEKAEAEAKQGKAETKTSGLTEDQSQSKKLDDLPSNETVTPLLKTNANERFADGDLVPAKPSGVQDDLNFTPVEFDDQEIKHILDTLLTSAPVDNPRFSDAISPRWALQVLGVADDLNCNCYEVVRRLVARILCRIKRTDLGALNEKVFVDIVEDLVKEGTPSEVAGIANVVDSYLEELDGKDQLTPEIFAKLMTCVPKESRMSYDVPFCRLEKILQSDKDITAAKKEKLLEMIEFGKLSEACLQRAHQSDLMPTSYVTQAALALCSKLRAELESAKSVIRSQETELERYGSGGRGRTWLAKYDTGQAQDLPSRQHSSYSYSTPPRHSHSGSTTASSQLPLSDLELHLTLQSVERRSRGTAGDGPASADLLSPSSTSNNYGSRYGYDSRDSGFESHGQQSGGSDVYNQHWRNSRPTRHLQNNASWTTHHTYVQKY